MIETLSVYFEIAVALLTYGGIVFFISAFISKFFKWAPFRILLLWFSIVLLGEVLQSEQILFNINLYIALGMAAPHIKFAHILAYRIYYGAIDFYHRLVEIFYMLLRPFIFVYGQYARFRAYYDARGQQGQQEQERNYEEFRQREGFNDYRRSREQQSHHRQEHSSNKEETHTPGGNSGSRQSQTSRWDSPDPYTVLDISRDATAQEIKKQYRKLQKLYHPDLTQTKKEEYTRISQQINAAYSKLKGVQ